MLSVKGIFRKGVALPTERIEVRENQPVIITFLGDEQAEVDEENDWSELVQLVEDCVVDTRIKDLAHQHNHYLYGTPKKHE